MKRKTSQLKNNTPGVLIAGPEIDLVDGMEAFDEGVDLELASLTGHEGVIATGDNLKLGRKIRVVRKV